MSAASSDSPATASEPLSFLHLERPEWAEVTGDAVRVLGRFPILPAQMSAIIARADSDDPGQDDEPPEQRYSLHAGSYRHKHPEMPILVERFGRDFAEVLVELVNHYQLWACPLAGKDPTEATLMRAYVELFDMDELIEQVMLPAFGRAAAALGGYQRGADPSRDTEPALLAYDMLRLLGSLRALQQRPRSQAELENCVRYARGVTRGISAIPVEQTAS